jgi:hypothetical protein
VRLGAVEPALAEQAARADRDLRLDDVVSGTQRIRFRIKKGQHAATLVIVHEVPQHGRGRRSQRTKEHDQAQAQPSKQYHQQPGARHQQRSAEIRLPDNQEGRRGDQHQQYQHVDESRRQRPVVQIPGRHHRHRQLHDLRRLEAHNAEVEPALRALAEVPGDHYREQQGQARRK